MRNLLTATKPRFFVTLLSVPILILLMLDSVAYSQGSDEQQWWFNVELIIFKRILPPSNNEDFDQAQFKLDTTRANNLLYLAALKQASLYKALHFALPICNAELNNKSKFAVNFDFEFFPKSANKRFIQTQATDTISVVEVSKEASLEIEENNDVDAAFVNLAVSNQELMTDLLTPLIIEQDVNIDAIEDGIDSRANSLAQDQTEDSNLREIHLASLNNSAALLYQEIKQNDAIQNHIACLNAEPQEPVLTQSALLYVGPEIFSKTSYFTGASQIISAEESFMQDYAEKVLKQRDIQPLLYTAWRQEVEFGIENAEFYKVRAGNLLETFEEVNYEKWHQQYEAAAINNPQTDEETFFADLKADLILNESVDWLATESASSRDIKTTFNTQKKYELEGQLKVFLDYVNQVPYLHIDSEFKHYRVVVDNEQNSILQSFPLKQRRRVISRQIHYFDHPAFGLIVRLERFTPPVVEEVVIENTNTYKQ